METITEKTKFEDVLRVPLFIPGDVIIMLSTVKKLNAVGTLEEVLHVIEEYIYNNRLFDVKDPTVIHCDEAMRIVFDVKEFSLRDLRDMMLKKFLEENGDYSSNGPNPKRVCLRNSDDSFCDDTYSDDSEDSTQRLAKELARDFITFKETYEVEYEVESISSGKSYSVTDSGSEIEDIFEAEVISGPSRFDEDEEFWADCSSDDYSNSDREISAADKWKCKTCGSLNKPPMRYCLKCWEERKDWVSPREEKAPRRRSRKARTKRRNKLCVEPFDGKESSKSCSKDESNDTCKTTDDDSFSQPGTSQVSTCTSSQETSQDYLTSKKLCILCCEKPMNAVVTHGNIAHQFSCYRCARKLLSLRKPCPICRRPLNRVLHCISV